MFINKVNANNISYNFPYQRKKETACKTTAQTTPLSYPAFNGVPYGIYQNPYIKLEESTLPTGDKVCTYKLINGHIVSIVQKNGCPILKTSFNVGSFDEPDGKEGESHLIEHSIFHSSKKYEDVEQSIKDIGGYSNASTGYNKTNYYIKLGDFNKETIQQALDILADMVFNPKFTKTEKERKIVIKESEECEADEKDMLEMQSLKKLFSIKKSAKDVTAGNKESIEAITDDDMFYYHNYFYTPENSVTSVTTPYDPDEIIKLASKSFLEAANDRTNHPIIRREYPVSNQISRNDIISKESDKKHTSFDFVIPCSKPEDIAKLSLIYEWVSTSPNFSFNWQNIYGNYAKVAFTYIGNDENEYNAFESLKENLQRLGSECIDENELSKLKRNALKQLEQDYKEGEDVTSNINSDYLNFGHLTFNQEKNAINSTSAKDLSEFSRLFDMSKCTMNVIHPKGTTKETLDSNLEKYKNYIPPIIIPKTVQNIDISNSLRSYNIFPLSSEQVLNGNLPDNTNITFLNSKSDDCSIQWLIANPDLSSYNPAAKYVLDNMLSGVFQNIEEYSNRYGIDSKAIFSFENGFFLNSDCKKEYLNLAIEELKKAFDITFSEEEFEKAKNAAINDIKNESNNESAFNMFYSERCGQNLTLNREQLLNSLKELTLNDLKKYFNLMLTNSGSTVAIKAPFIKHPELINSVASKINIPNFSFKQEPELKSVYNPSVQNKCYIKTKNQPYYANVFSFKINGNQKDSITFDILAQILYQRLYNSLREEKGYSYRINSSVNKENDMGMLTIGINTSLSDKEDIEKIFSEFRKQVEDLKTKPVTQKELKEAKNTIKMNQLSMSEDDFSVLFKIINTANLPYGLRNLEENTEITDSITDTDILSAANYIFKSKPDVLIEANQEIINKNKDYFEQLA